MASTILVPSYRVRSVWTDRCPVTPAELRCLIDAAKGLTVAETAAKWGVSVETIKYQRKWGMARIGVRTVTQAVALLIVSGHITADDLDLGS